jgi:hypothetical protein
MGAQGVSEPHDIYGIGIDQATAKTILRLLERSDSQSTLNGLAMKYRVAKPSDDAVTVRKRLRNLAEGLLQFLERQKIPPGGQP